MLSGIPIPVPIILMNGVAVYDIQNGRYIKTHTIEKSSLQSLLAAIKRHDTEGFLYCLEGDRLSTYYEELRSDHAKRFVEERVQKYGKRFTRIDDFSELLKKPVIYFSVCDLEENLAALHKELCRDKNLHIEYYRDIYEDGYRYLEACSSEASKHNAAKFLREEYGFDKVVSFGDNLNDLPLFAASDESYAVANAKPEVKEKASAVIGGNEDDGVAKWLLEL